MRRKEEEESGRLCLNKLGIVPNATAIAGDWQEHLKAMQVMVNRLEFLRQVPWMPEFGIWICLSE